MGWYQIKAVIVGHRSAHNSINDDLDKVRMEWFIKDVRQSLSSGALLYVGITILISGFIALILV